MSDGRREFAARLGRLTRRHQALARGYTASLRGDGLIVIEPRRLQFRLPVRGFVLLMAFFMVFKGFMMFSLGDAGYKERLTLLSGGTLFEQAGALIMGIDPVSQSVANALREISG